MRFIYETYTATPPAGCGLVVPPGSAWYVFNNTSTSSELRHFVFALLARAGTADLVTEH
jgi:hypothetical protein